MPRERLSIRTFGNGMVPAIDSFDAKQDSAFWCENVDLMAREGFLWGLPADENKTSSIGAVGNAQGHGFIQKLDGKYTFVYFNAYTGNIDYLNDFYGTPGTLTTLTAIASCPQLCFAKKGQVLRVGGTSDAGLHINGQWIGYTSNEIFGHSSSALIVKNQELDESYGTSPGQFAITGVADGSASTDGFFVEEKIYYYKLAVEYDGYQYSILNATSVTREPATDSASLAITIRAYNGATSPSSFNLRQTALLLFRAEGSNVNTVPDTEYQLVERIPFSHASWATASTDHKDITITDVGLQLGTYNSYSGLAETATESILRWKIGCIADNYMVIGNCYLASLPDAPYMIFRSVAGRPDVYDFLSSSPAFLRLPNPPTAMISYFGRVIVFDENNMYRINVDAMAIEEVISGYGCIGQQSVLATQYGVFFANINGVYLYDGKQIQRISDAIQEFTETPTYDLTGSDPQTINNSSYVQFGTYINGTNNNVKLVYHSKHDLLIMGASVNSVTTVYGYCVGRKSWTLLSVPAPAVGASFSFITGKDGEVYLAHRNGSTDQLYKYLSNHASRRTFVWISQRFASKEGDYTQHQKVYYLNTSGSGSFYVRYGVDGATIQQAPSSGAINASYVRNTSFRFVLVSTGASDYISNVSLIFRRMIGERR